MTKHNLYISKEGHLTNDFISLYIDALLLGHVNKLPNEVLEHVEDCKICKQRILEGYDILKETEEVNVNEHPYFGAKKKELKKTRFLVQYKIVASVVFIISLGIIGFYVLNNKPETSNKIAEGIEKKSETPDSINENVMLPKDTLKAIDNQEVKNQPDLENEIDLNNLIAENKLEGEEFQVSPIMLSMLGTNIRSDFFEAKHPKDSTIFENDQPISFMWDSDIEEEIVLKVFNYKDELVFESMVLESNEFDLTEALMPGAYIWKIESTDDMFHLGLFFVLK